MTEHRFGLLIAKGLAPQATVVVLDITECPPELRNGGLLAVTCMTSLTDGNSARRDVLQVRHHQEIRGG